MSPFALIPSAVPWALSAVLSLAAGWQYIAAQRADVATAQAKEGQAQAQAYLANYIATSQAAALKDSQAQRVRASKYQQTITTLGASIDTEKTLRGAAERAAADSLRQLDTAIAANTPGSGGATSPDTTPTDRANAAPRAGQLLGQCAHALVAVAASADTCQSNLTGLQGYVRDVLKFANSTGEN
jgi:hypothetical protein